MNPLPFIRGKLRERRAARALADAALKWWEKIRAGEKIGGIAELKRRAGFQEFENNFIGHLTRLGIKSAHA